MHLWKVKAIPKALSFLSLLWAGTEEESGWRNLMELLWATLQWWPFQILNVLKAWGRKPTFRSVTCPMYPYYGLWKLFLETQGQEVLWSKCSEARLGSPEPLLSCLWPMGRTAPQVFLLTCHGTLHVYLKPGVPSTRPQWLMWPEKLFFSSSLYQVHGHMNMTVLPSFFFLQRKQTCKQTNPTF